MGVKMNNKSKWFAKSLKISMLIAAAMSYFYVSNAFGDADIGTIATTITQTFSNIGKLMAASAYLAGFGLVIAAIFKFKQHKDNPTQIPMGTPIALLAVGVALIFVPSFVSPAGWTLFSTGGYAGGFTGKGITALPGGA